MQKKKKKKKKLNLTIGFDIMGSDNSPSILLKAAKSFAKKGKIVVFGTKEFEPPLASCPLNLTYISSSTFISMEDNPIKVIKEKEGSSLILGIKQLLLKKIDVLVSAGNTGALLVATKWYLPLLSKIKRPALLTLIPTAKRDVALIDAGANANCKPENIVQFALMGIALQKARGCRNPKVALLNIGSEASKGTESLKLAYEALSKQKFNFIGNVEGKDVFQMPIDVLVTDGFTGNIFLKTAEGTANFILEKSAKLLELPPFLLSSLKEEFFPVSEALLCGLDGLILKCHGHATPKNILNTLHQAHLLATNDFLTAFKRTLSSLE